MAEPRLGDLVRLCSAPALALAVMLHVANVCRDGGPGTPVAWDDLQGRFPSVEPARLRRAVTELVELGVLTAAVVRDEN